MSQFNFEIQKYMELGLLVGMKKEKLAWSISIYEFCVRQQLFSKIKERNLHNEVSIGKFAQGSVKLNKHCSRNE